MLGMGLSLAETAVRGGPGGAAPFNPLSLSPAMYWPLSTNLTDASGNGRDLTAAGGAAVTGGFLVLDGVDDKVTCTSPNLGTAMTVICVLDPQAGDEQFMLYESSGFSFLAASLDADGNSPHQVASGNPSYFINGVAIAKNGGGGTFSTRDDIHDALSFGGGRVVFEIRGADLSANWANFGISVGGYGAAWFFKGRVREVIVCADPADPTALRTYMATKL